uniref:Uncharacterized protein n=1 Tax=Cannabis sativa TaxID=3483 RepID=A0A803QAP3_CANSA
MTVGDGRHIDTFRDPWLSRLIMFCPITSKPRVNLLVKGFIDVNGSWNIQALCQVFLPMDVEVILSIPLVSGALVGFEGKGSREGELEGVCKGSRQSFSAGFSKWVPPEPGVFVLSTDVAVTRGEVLLVLKG